MPIRRPKTRPVCGRVVSSIERIEVKYQIQEKGERRVRKSVIIILIRLA